jgi:spoIIIJ-associated protein
VNKVKREITVSAKTVEDAVAKAVAELSAPDASAIEYTVIEEAKKGFLGIGASDAKISASYTVKGAYAAFEMIKKVVDDIGLEANVTLKHTGEGEACICVDSKDNGNEDKDKAKDAGVLIGHHGETLDALQYLSNLSANRKIPGEKKEYVKMTVDVEGYRAKREETLRSLARKMADKVLKNKKSVMLEPMNPYERRIIHSEIQNIDGVSTNSIGSENNRKIVIYLVDKEQ